MTWLFPATHQNSLASKFKAKFVVYKVSLISKIGLVVFELLIKTYPSKK
jgi:hypothetical protein